jgi:eukaryotic-like serine/threonine-protein kinase
MNLSLGHRIFIAFSGLLILILGFAAGITYYRGNKIAEHAVISALENIRIVQQGFESRRFQQLELISEIFASDPYFSSYVAEAAGGNLGLGGEVDTQSIVDLLIERQQDLGFDFAMVLNGDGEVIAHTIEEDLIGSDMSDDPLVGDVIETLESATGYWLRNDNMFQVAAVPLADQQDLVGFLLTGLIVDDKFVKEIKSISGSELILFSNQDNKFKSIVGTLDQEDLELLITNDALIKSAVGKDPIELKLSSGVWLATVNNTDASGSTGLTVALTSLDEASADFRAIENVLLIVTAISIFLALPLSLLISRKVLAPVRQLAVAAQAAARGDYQQRFESSGKDELAKLTSAFDVLLSDLREKNDMQGYMTDLAKYLPDTMESKGGITPEISKDSEAGSYALLGIDLRRFAKQADKMSPEEVFALMNASLKNIDSLTRAYGGHIIGAMGHRVIIVFKGQDDYKRALSMSGTVLSTLMSQDEGVAVAVSEGHAVIGSVLLGESHIKNILGSSVFQLNRLIAESISKHIFISPGILERIKSEMPSFKPVLAEGVISKNKFYCLRINDTHQFEVQAEGDTLHATQITRGGSTTTKRVHIAPGMSLGGRYEIISELGAGGMGVVYKAHDHELNDLVALKMLRINDEEGAGEFLEAMKSEIVLARKITHPAVLRTYDYGELDGVPYISMEYVRGLTLKYLLQQSEKIPYSAGLRIAKQLAAGLQAAHDQGVLHRDIKAENLILEHNGSAKIMDFGIARQVSGPGLGELEGSIVGTPRYAAPEQLAGKPVDATADIYSAGILLYHMYTGSFPFIAKSMQRLIAAKNNDEPAPPSKYWKEIPPELEKLIMSCIARKPKDRIQSAALLLDELEKLRA